MSAQAAADELRVTLCMISPPVNVTSSLIVYLLIYEVLWSLFDQTATWRAGLNKEPLPAIR